MDLNQEYSIITEICNNICKDPNLVGDLTQEISLVWLDLREEKKTAIRESGSFRWWAARTIKQQWASSSSPFYTKYRKNAHQEYQSHHSPAEEEYDTEPDENYALLQKHVRALFPSEYNIFNSYYKQNLTIMQITHKFGVDKNFVWSTLKRVRDSLSRKIRWEMNGWRQEDMQELLAPFIGRRRLKADERQVILDIHWVVNGQNINSIYDRDVVDRVLKNLVTSLKM